MDLVFARGASDRQSGHFLPWRQVNIMIESTKTDPKQLNLLSRPPLESYYTWGTGPVHGLFQRPGVLGGDLFAVIGTKLFRNGVDKGTIGGTGAVSWAATASEILVTRGSSLYSYNGTNLVTVTFPDTANVRAVGFLSTWFVAIRSGSDRWYFSAQNDGRTWDALDYATAESESDELYDVLFVGDVMYLLGANSTEPWVLTGVADLPFSRISNSVLPHGVQGTSCAKEMDGTMYLIGGDGVVYRREGVLSRISEHWLEEKIRQSAAGSAFTYFYEGHLVFVVKIDGECFGFDLAAPPGAQWFELTSHNRSNFAPKCAVNIMGEPLFGDDTSAVIWAFGEFGATDAGEETMPRVFSAGAPLNTQPQAVYNVLVDGNAGDTPVETGQASDPILEMRFSRDGGRTWSAWRPRRWGQQGEYRRRARFGSCGYMDPPGFLAEFQMLAVAPLRVSGARANESQGGRSQL